MGHAFEIPRRSGRSPNLLAASLAAIAADQTLSEPVRQRALQFAREWKQYVVPRRDGIRHTIQIP